MMRLNAIGQVRAQIIAARMSPNFFQPGHPRFSRAATAMEASANGRAKTVWLNFTNSAHFRIMRNIENSTPGTGPGYSVSGDFKFNPSPPPILSPASAVFPDGQAPAPPPCPPPVRWSLDDCKRTDWPE